MTTFPPDCCDDVIRDAVVAWSQLLAQGKFAQALAMFEHTSEYLGVEWTSERLEDCVSNYGVPRAGFDGGKYHKVTSLFEQPDSRQFIQKAIKVDRENLYGLDRTRYVGMVHYDDVPLDGKPSDLTARFHIKKIGAHALTLEFLDIHVM